jgi:hypothetical protein
MDDETSARPGTMVPVQIEGGPVILVEARSLGGEEQVGAKLPRFEDVTEAVEGIAAAFSETMARIQPKKASVEFGVEVGLESGQLTALLVKGTGKANLKITLQWES